MWVQQYSGLVSLPNSSPCAEDFYSTLLPQGSSFNGFRHGDSVSLAKAHDTDIQELQSRTVNGQQVVDIQGEDQKWAEKVDMLYFCGHGDPSQLYFGEGNPFDHDDVAHYDEVKLGDQALKWLVLDACRVLDNAPNGFGGWTIFNRWAKAFKPGGGLRYILGFHTTCKNDNFRGRYFAEYLNPIPGGSTDGELIRIAWQYACEETEPWASQWALLRVGDNTFAIANDKWTDTNLQDVPTIPSGRTQKFTYQKRIGPEILIPEVVV